jgi:uncharacterized protein YbjT (DUF2867 family)
MRRVLVIGGSSKVGGHVLPQLQATGAHVLVLARNPETVRLPSQVDVARGDLTLPESLGPSLEGIDTVFLVWTAPPRTVPAVLERIAKQARRIVFLSSPYKTAHPFFSEAPAQSDFSAA